jgi:NAD(P)-dependent dehydrogenase (short-subunit alcohol dehydrogenase family)
MVQSRSCATHAISGFHKVRCSDRCPLRGRQASCVIAAAFCQEGNMNETNIILITGAGSGFGRLSAIELARAGHIVYASMRDLDGRNKDKGAALRDLARHDDLQLYPLELDVRIESACHATANFILGRHGRIDVVVNNAAMIMAGIAEAFRPEQYAEIFDVNAISWIRVNRAFLPAMRRQGKGLLVYISCPIAHIPDPLTGPYAASKAAGDVLAQAMALENSRYGIESVVLMAGAYTADMDDSRDIIGPADTEVAAQYERVKGLAAQLAGKLDAVNVPGARTDAAEVAEAVRDIVALKHGTRPARVEVDPQRRGALQIVEFAQARRAAFFRRMGIDDLLATTTQNVPV